MLTKTAKSISAFLNPIIKANISYQVQDIKNSHLVYVKDPEGRLPFMGEVVSKDGKRGVVIKLAQKGTSVIGMYNNIESNSSIDLEVVRSNQKQVKFNRVYDINFEQIAEIKNVQQNSSLSTELIKQGKRTRVKTLNNILSISHDIFVGDFVNFTGPFGSGRTTSAIKTLQLFTNSSIEKPFGIYLNTNINDFKQTCLQAGGIFRTVAFGRNVFEIQKGQIKKEQLSSVGVYMLAVKCIKLAKKMREKGNNVFLVIDNIHEIVANQWTVLQSLNLPVSSFSILNQLYSGSTQGSINNKKTGSQTTIVISNPQSHDVIQQYTTLGNNTKYLKTLATQIAHPLQLTVNTNTIKSEKTLGKMRQKINKLVREEKDKDLLTKLKLTKDEPWQHYYLLDSEWWVPGLKKFQPKTLSERDLFIWFVNKNIEQDWCAHWRIDCISAFNKYLDYLARPKDLSVGRDLHQLQNFTQLCKMEGTFDIFKKDYLN